MILSRTSAIVLGSIRLGEANRLVTFLTPGRGRLVGMAYNARRPNRRFGSALELFTHCELLLAERRPHHQIDIRQASVIERFPSIRTDLALIEAASRLVMLIRAFLPEAAPHPKTFEILDAALTALGKGRPVWLTLRLFELGLLRDTGYEPHLDRCVRCQPERREEPSSRELFFSSQAGGVVCDRCLQAGGRGYPIEPLGQRLPVSRGVLAFLRQAARLGLAKGERLRPSPLIRDESEQLLRHYIRWLLDRPSLSDRLEAPMLGHVAPGCGVVAGVNISSATASYKKT